MLLFIRLVVLTFFVFLLNACSLQAISEQSSKIEKMAQISGKVFSDNENSNSVVVAILTFKDDKFEIINQQQINGNNEYHFNLFPGEYLVGAYIDHNNNQRRDLNENGVMHNSRSDVLHPVTLKERQKISLPLMTISTKNQLEYEKDVKYSIDVINANTGRVVSIDDPMFSKENSSIGLWRPLDFINNVGGGLLFLQPYDESKTPVLFVHGMSGSPAEFKTIIAQLDTDKFQPWVLYYPSGVALELVSEFMLDSLLELNSKYSFKKMQLISHSMGGLVSRTFLMHHDKAKTDFNISLFVTINSPLYGMDSAASGVASSPIVLSSWRDVATGSDYIKAAHAWTIPKDLPYHLFFSYLPDEDGDGVVPLRSQLSLSLQEEATKIHGSQASHAGILIKPDFIQRLIDVMQSPNK